ncbi:MAG: hypothetical protein HYZ57_10645 [Acidobacteria bacterium]|nr:hypothetical protein [Acidobacteriota bacterium]MBI3280287.1 hypothetical protein [Acidobacteriota bacterium]
MSRAAGLVCAAVLSSGCGRYADFTLPPAGPPEHVSFRWEPRPGPVLARSMPGEWDSVDALNPSVVRRGGRLFNFYSGYDGRTWRTGLATSGDGLVWQKLARLLTPDPKTWEGGYIAANGSTLWWEGHFRTWYQAGRAPRIGLAMSADGSTWQKRAAPVLEVGPRGSWDERGAADPYVVEAGGTLYLYYLGQDRARRQRLGVARSRDGVTWEKLRTNPIFELGSLGSFDEIGLGEPAVWLSHGSYWMLYTGRDRGEHRRIGLARSQDGVRWQRSSEAPLISGTEPWNAKVVCDPTVLLEAGEIRVWYGGGDVAHPAENIHGQIGYGVLRAAAP